MKYAVCYNPSAENEAQSLKSELAKHDIYAEIFDTDNLCHDFDFVFVAGGDGTILKAARFYSKSNALIFGVNLGHLGFLSQAGTDELEYAVEKIINKDYKIEKRLMLEAQGVNALNDIVIKAEHSSRASNFRLEIDGKFVCEYFADGVIISTPTGSTAYNMASGGPVLTPDLEALVISPICPHTFSARPIVVNSDSEIKVSSIPDLNYCVSADGQEVFSFKDEILIKKSEYKANLVLLNNNDFYSVLRNKLHWGITLI